jgi:hypothetical protein
VSRTFGHFFVYKFLQGATLLLQQICHSSTYLLTRQKPVPFPFLEGFGSWILIILWVMVAFCDTGLQALALVEGYPSVLCAETYSKPRLNACRCSPNHLPLASDCGLGRGSDSCPANLQHYCPWTGRFDVPNQLHHSSWILSPSQLQHPNQLDPARVQRYHSRSSRAIHSRP